MRTGPHNAGRMFPPRWVVALRDRLFTPGADGTPALADRVRDRLRQVRVSRVLFYCLLASPGVLPLLAPYPPLQDYAGHLGMIGLSIHRGEPAAQVERYYRYMGWLQPNTLYYFMAFLFAKVLPPLTAASLTFAIALGGLGPAVARLCRAAGADDRLAVLALPLAFGMHFARGFAPNALGLVIFALSIAAYLELRADPTWRRGAWLGALMVISSFAHFFVALASAGLILAGGVMDLFRRWRAALMAIGAALLTPTVVWLTLQDVPVTEKVGFKVLVDRILNEPRVLLKDYFWKNLFPIWPDGDFDDFLQKVWIGIVLFGVLAALVLERRRFFRAERWRLLVMILGTVVAFVAVPRTLPPPIEWWGANLRLPLMTAILTIPLVGRVLVERWPTYAAVGGTVSALFAGLVIADVTDYSSKEMDGLREVLEAVPQGLTIATLYYPGPRLAHYSDQPLLYVSQYYLLIRGGYVPNSMGIRRGVPFFDDKHLHIPAVSNAWEFSWPAHGTYFDGFVVRPKAGRPESPFDAGGRENVRLVKEAGNWRYYVRLGGRAAPAPPPPPPPKPTVGPPAAKTPPAPSVAKTPPAPPVAKAAPAVKAKAPVPAKAVAAPAAAKPRPQR
jgi:hypothetical protein